MRAAGVAARARRAAPAWVGRLSLAAGAALAVPALAADANRIEQGRLLFTQGAAPACAICHSLKAAGASGEIGPSLDELKPDARRVANALRNGIGQMPSYADSLSAEQIAQLAAYVEHASGRGK